MSTYRKQNVFTFLIITILVTAYIAYDYRTDIVHKEGKVFQFEIGLNEQNNSAFESLGFLPSLTKLNMNISVVSLSNNTIGEFYMLTDKQVEQLTNGELFPSVRNEFRSFSSEGNFSFIYTGDARAEYFFTLLTETPDATIMVEIDYTLEVQPYLLRKGLGLGLLIFLGIFTQARIIPSIRNYIRKRKLLDKLRKRDEMEKAEFERKHRDNIKYKNEEE